MMVTKMNDYGEGDDDDDVDFEYRDNMVAQFKKYLFSKSFSHRDQDKRDDGLQKKLSFDLVMFLLMRQHQ